MALSPSVDNNYPKHPEEFAQFVSLIEPYFQKYIDLTVHQKDECLERLKPYEDSYRTKWFMESYDDFARSSNEALSLLREKIEPICKSTKYFQEFDEGNNEYTDLIEEVKVIEKDFFEISNRFNRLTSAWLEDLGKILFCQEVDKATSFEDSSKDNLADIFDRYPAQCEVKKDFAHAALIIRRLNIYIRQMGTIMQYAPMDNSLDYLMRINWCVTEIFQRMPSPQHIKDHNS
ncbi:hypothetical protein [Simkania sp.]|uniref:hypothetical protein n=1 Tax=Simkania sp. TaxID=34094 RepID=UPI003B52DA0E